MAETTQTADHIEHEIERERSALRATLDEVTRRLTGADLTGTVQETVRSVGEDIGHRLPQTVRRNPIPAAMIAAGAGWLIWSALKGRDDHGHAGAGQGNAFGFQRGQGTRDIEPGHAREEDPRGNAYGYVNQRAHHPAYTGETDPMARREHDGEGWGERLQDNAEALRDWLAEGTETLSDAARERIATARRRALDAQVKLERAARERITETIDDRPLLVGAIGFVAGLVAGALLPATRREDETIGAWRDRMFDEAERVFHEEKQKAAQVVQAAAEEGRRAVGEALDQASDRLADGEQLVEKAKDTARATVERMAETAREEAVRQKLGKIR